MHSAAQFSKTSVSPRRCNQVQTSADGFGHSRSNRLLGSLQQVRRNLDSDFSHGLHTLDHTILNTSIKYGIIVASEHFSEIVTIR